MICTNCYKSFEGKGTVCPVCLPGGYSEDNGSRYSESHFVAREKNSVYPAGLLGRFIANLFDTLLLCVGINLILAPLMINFLLDIFNKVLMSFSHTSSFVYMVVIGNVVGIFAVLILLMLISPLYYVLFECSRYKATPGKILMGLMVTDMQNNKLSFSRALFRLLGRFTGILPVLLSLCLPFILPPQIAGKLVLSCLLLGSILFLVTYPLIIFTTYKQGLHDLISKCIVQESDNRAPKFGLAAAIGGIIIFSVLIFLFTEKSGNEIKFKNNNFESKLDVLDRKIKEISEKHKFEGRKITVNEKSEPDIIKKEPAEISAKIVHQDLPDGMHAAVNGNIKEFSRVKAMLGSTMKTVVLEYYSNETDTLPDFKVAMYFKWPISDRCDLSDIERYDVMFFNQNKDNSFKFPDNKKNFILSRYGGPPAGETLGLFCKKDENTITMTTMFKGSASNNNSLFSWNIQNSAALKLPE